MAGSLSHVGNRKLVKAKGYQPILPVKHLGVELENSEFKQAKGKERDEKEHGKKFAKSGEIKKNFEAKASDATEDSYHEQKIENDLTHQKIPDSERIRELAGKSPPFEEAEKEDEGENESTHRKIADTERLHGNTGKLSPFEVAESNVESENDLNPQKIPDNEKNHENTENALFPKVAKKDEELPQTKISQEKGKQMHEARHDKVTVRKDRKKSQKHDPSRQKNNILMVLAKVGQTSPLAQRFKRCIKSICTHSTIHLTFHILTDNLGKLTSDNTFNEAAKVCRNGLNVTYYDVGEVVKKVQPVIKDLKPIFTNGDPNSYYSDSLFFVSTAIHHVLPKNMMRIISLDSDLLFQADIKHLFSEFDTFKSSMVLGLAREQQPVYRHVLHMFRNRNPGTIVGGPPPNGLTGFNSGVVLVNLHNMRKSKLYNSLLNGSVVKELANRYSFQGHLGDQDFYSLISLEYPELFHILPCSWNRQLCTYWKDHGYTEVFDSYFNCSGPIHVYHGNCGTKMPNE